MNPELKYALDGHGILSRRAQPHLIGAIDRAVQGGTLTPLFPGTYAAERTYATLLLALVDWDPDAVLTSGSAAALTWWPDLDVATVDAVTRRQLRRQVDGVKVSQRALHHDLVVTEGAFNVQHPSASVLDLAREMGPSALDEALRRRAVSPASLRWAQSLMPGREGNPLLTQYLRASRDAPWSHLEREGHELLRKARISGWKANYRVQLPSGTIFIDVAFPGRKLAIEFDGWEFHGDRASFIRDRRRDNELVLLGWTVLRYASDSLHEVVRQVERLLAVAWR